MMYGVALPELFEVDIVRGIARERSKWVCVLAFLGLREGEVLVKRLSNKKHIACK